MVGKFFVAGEMLQLTGVQTANGKWQTGDPSVLP
jgi:hypothetical protein